MTKTALPPTQALIGKLRALRILPVITIDDAANAVPLARALAEGGLPAAEITFRTAGAAEAIHRIAAEVPEVLLGAGTVLAPKQVDEALAAGATFIVSPGFGPAVVDRCQELGVPVFPGVCTPTEIEAALAKGLAALKFFPAEPMGGVKFLRAIMAPYGMIDFMPTGGVNAENVRDYLALEKVVACGGSWMAPADWIAGAQFDRIRLATERAVAAVHPPAGVVV